MNDYYMIKKNLRKTKNYQQLKRPKELRKGYLFHTKPFDATLSFYYFF